MINRLTIRGRILVIFILITVTGGSVQFVIAGGQLRAATLEFYQHHLETDAFLVATTFAEPLGHYLEGEGSGDIGRILTVLQQEIGHHYLIVDRNFRVVGYSPQTGYEQVEHVPQTPELVAARSERLGADIRPNWRGEDTLYLAVAVLYENQSLGYVVLSEPMQPAYAQVNQRYLELAAATIPVIALVIAASLWISGTISRPIERLRNSAVQMASGALDTRIPITAHDELGQLAESFNDMAGKLETLMRTQRSFVSNAAHEMRTPLMTLKLRAEALTDETLPAPDRDTYLCEIRQEIDHMAALVSSLLTLARLDEGRHPQYKITTDSVAALHDITRHWRIAAEAAGLRFIAHIDPNLPDLPMSPIDLRLILDNLLGNALKYTPQGEIRLVVAQQQQGGFTLAVSDSGVGFSSAQAAHLFERFYRSEHVRGQFAGNGLGLSVVQAILSYCGGTIEAHSDGMGKGATFTVRLVA